MWKTISEFNCHNKDVIQIYFLKKKKVQSTITNKEKGALKMPNEKGPASLSVLEMTCELTVLLQRKERENLVLSRILQKSYG